jgi:lysozyme family protein
MVTFNDLFRKVIKHEGYYANVKGDRGGETYMGVARNLHPNWPGWCIIDEYKKIVGTIDHNEKIQNLELYKLVKAFYKGKFYNRFNIGEINHGSLQEIIFDWCVNSGSFGSRGVQRVLNRYFGFCLKMDGIIGTLTASAINSIDPETLFDAIKTARINFYHKIAQKGQNHKFLRGWLNRINKIEFEE